MTTLNFHVRHEVNPERVWSVLDALANGLEYDHITQYDRQLSRLRQLGLVAGRGDISLTEDGLELHRIGIKRLEVIWELMHYLHYTRWRMSKPTDNTMFFTYREYCNLLHSKLNIEVAPQRDRFAAEMTGLITSSSYFSRETSQLAKGAVSLSTNSLVGVEHWLTKLSPEVIEDGQFTLRHYCSPELLLMALGFITEVTEAQLGVEQPLSQERREMLGRICLIEDNVLDQILDWIFPEYPDFVQPGTHTGSYGRFIRVLKIPSLKDLLR
jgi:hypothetical protein